MILTDISFRAQAGDTLAIVGAFSSEANFAQSVSRFGFTNAGLIHIDGRLFLVRRKSTSSFGLRLIARPQSFLLL